MTKYEEMARKSGALVITTSLTRYPSPIINDYEFSKDKLEKFAELILQDYLEEKSKQF